MPLEDVTNVAKAPLSSRPRARRYIAKYSTFYLTGRLGSGSFGLVYKSRDAQHRQIALKIVLLENLKTKERTVEPIECETLCWRRCNNHENIVRLFECKQVICTFYYSMERTIGDVYLLMDAFHEKKRLPESIVKRIVAQALNGLLFMHSQGVIHRDVKPSNMLISRDGRVMHADFGWSKLLKLGETTRTRGGTAEYLAPEYFNSRTYDHAVDLWALGTCMYEWIVGSNYLVTKMRSDIHGYAKKVEFLERNKDLFDGFAAARALSHSSASPSACSVIRQFLDMDPSLRLGYNPKDPLGEFQRVMCKNFFKELKGNYHLPKDVIEKILCENSQMHRPDKIARDMRKLEDWKKATLPDEWNDLFKDFEWSVDEERKSLKLEPEPKVDELRTPPKRRRIELQDIPSLCNAPKRNRLFTIDELPK